MVIFDRWGGCYLYSGVYLMEVSEKVKESLRAYRGKAVLIDAQDVEQPMNPGDGLIIELAVLGPAKPAEDTPFGRPSNVSGLSLRVMPAFQAQSADELVVELPNDGSSSQQINADELGPTLLSSKNGTECNLWDPSDGPSTALITRVNVNSLYRAPAAGSCTFEGKARTIQLSLAPGVAIARRLPTARSIATPCQRGRWILENPAGAVSFSMRAEGSRLLAMTGLRRPKIMLRNSRPSKSLYCRNPLNTIPAFSVVDSLTRCERTS